VREHNNTHVGMISWVRWLNERWNSSRAGNWIRLCVSTWKQPAISICSSSECCVLISKHKQRTNENWYRRAVLSRGARRSGNTSPHAYYGVRCGISNVLGVRAETAEKSRARTRCVSSRESSFHLELDRGESDGACAKLTKANYSRWLWNSISPVERKFEGKLGSKNLCVEVTWF